MMRCSGWARRYESVNHAVLAALVVIIARSRAERIANVALCRRFLCDRTHRRPFWLHRTSGRRRGDRQDIVRDLPRLVRRVAGGGTDSPGTLTSASIR